MRIHDSYLSTNCEYQKHIPFVVCPKRIATGEGTARVGHRDPLNVGIRRIVGDNEAMRALRIERKRSLFDGHVAGRSSKDNAVETGECL